MLASSLQIAFYWTNAASASFDRSLSFPDFATVAPANRSADVGGHIHQISASAQVSGDACAKISGQSTGSLAQTVIKIERYVLGRRLCRTF